MAFNIGDEVEVTRMYDSRAIPGMRGIVEGVRRSTLLIKFPVGFRGHSSEGRCWNVHEANLKLVNRFIKTKGFIMSAVEFVKKQALKTLKPDEYELREAGLHDDCGELTGEGEALRDMFLEELVLDKMIATAKEINADRKEAK